MIDPIHRMYGDILYYNQANGFAGTIYPIGTKDKPVNNTTDLRALLTALPWIKKVIVEDTITLLTAGPTFAGICFSGRGPRVTTMAVNGGAGFKENCVFENATITSVNLESSNITIRDCGRVDLGMIGAGVNVLRCQDVYIGGSGLVRVQDCNYVEFTSALGDFRVRNCHDVVVSSIGAGAWYFGFWNCDRITMSQSGDATCVTDIAMNDGEQVILTNGCVTGAVNIYGNATVTDKSAGATVRIFTNNVIAGCVNTALNPAAITDFDTDLTEVTNNHYNGDLLRFTSGVCKGQAHLIDVYTGASKNCAFATGDQWTDVPVQGDWFVIIPNPGAYLKKTFTEVESASLAAAGGSVANNTRLGSLVRWIADILNDATNGLVNIIAHLTGTVSTVGSPYSQPNDLVEHDAIIIAAAIQLVDIELDMVNLAQANTVREYVKVDGATYRQISAKIFPTDFDTGTKAVTFSFPQKGQLYKITMQSSVLEGGAKNVPYRIMTRSLS